MSLKLVGMVQDLAIGRPEREVLRVLCDAADDIPGTPGVGINCYPSIGKIAWIADYCDSQVRRLLRKLESISVVVPVAIHPTYSTTEYELHLEKAPKKPPFEPKKNRGGGRDLRPVISTGGAVIKTGRGDAEPLPQPVISTPRGRAFDAEKGAQNDTRPLKYVPSPENALFSIGGAGNNASASEYVAHVLKTFAQIPGAAPSSVDRRVAEKWEAEKVPLATVDAALCIGAARHIHSANFQSTLTLAYFKRVVEEILKKPVSPIQIEHIKLRLPDYAREREEFFRAQETAEGQHV